MHGLSAGIVDDQYLEGFVLSDAGQQFDFFQQAGGFQGAGEKLLATSAHCGQASWRVGLMQAEEQQRYPLLQAVLGLGRQLQAVTRAAEVDVHDDCRWQTLTHGGAKCISAVQGLYTEAEELQLLGQALGAVVVLEHDVDRLAQRRQRHLFELVALAQAGA
ncbi:hypothetical protein D3C79_651530 [compost metagenome]